MQTPGSERLSQGSRSTDKIIGSPARAAQIHEALGKLCRRLRAVDLPSDLTPERLGALGAIRAAGPVSLSELAEIEGVTPGTMSRMVSWLESKGLVRRRHHEHDGRAFLFSATPKGCKAQERALNESLLQIIDTISEMDSEELAAVAALLSDIRRRKR